MATNYFTIQADVPENALYSLMKGLEKINAINIIARPADPSSTHADLRNSRRQVAQTPRSQSTSQALSKRSADLVRSLSSEDMKRLVSELINEPQRPTTRAEENKRKKLHKNAPKGNYDVRAAVYDANLWMANALVQAHQNKEPIMRAAFAADINVKYPELRVTNYFTRWQQTGVIKRAEGSEWGDGAYEAGPNAEDFLKKIRG